MKLTGSKKIIGGVALAATMALAGGVAFAQQDTAPRQGGRDGVAGHMQHGGGKGMHGMKGGFAGRFAEKLNLTEAQKAQMEQISARYRESGKAMRQQGRAERGKGGFDAFTDGTFNEATVRAAAQARANARVEMEVAHARMMSEMYAVLTPEQKAQLATMRQQHEQRRQERRAGRDAGVNQQ